MAAGLLDMVYLELPLSTKAESRLLCSWLAVRLLDLFLEKKPMAVQREGYMPQLLSRGRRAAVAGRRAQGGLIVDCLADRSPRPAISLVWLLRRCELGTREEVLQEEVSTEKAWMCSDFDSICC